MAADDDHALDPRHEAVRGRAGAAGVLSERPAEWSEWLREAREPLGPHRSGALDGATEYLLWQTLVGAWPLDEERLQQYATKAVREAKLHTAWSDPDEEYEEAVAQLRERCPRRRHPARATWSPGSARPPAPRGDHARPEAAPAGPSRRPRRLPGRRDRRPVPRRPGQPASRRLRRSAPSGWPASTRVARPPTSTTRSYSSPAGRCACAGDHPEWFTGAAAHGRRSRTDDDHAFAVARGDSSGDHVVALVRGRPLARRLGHRRLALPAGALDATG